MTRVLLPLYRQRGRMLYVAVVILLGTSVVERLPVPDVFRAVWAMLVLVALGLFLLSVLLTFLLPRWLPVPPAQIVRSPVRGRWLGMNSPASKVPSHRVRAYGQAYAIDLVHEPEGPARPSFGGAMMRANQEYPAFGQPVFAMLDGTVVAASDWRRDHRARSNWFGFCYLLLEGMIREIAGPGFIVGNHVTIRGDHGTYATIAHLKQGSVTVAVGDRVVAGTVIGECGNSGNSSEPHVHAQLMDRGSFWSAQGLPMAFEQITLDDGPEAVDALPANEQHMTAVEAPRTQGA